MKTSISSERLEGLPSAGFADYLRQELLRRCSDNPHYSLRALAIDLGSDHGTLSQLMNGKRRLTSATIAQLGSRLGLPEARISAFQQRERLVGGNRPATLVEVQRLTAYAAQVVAQWHHFALLELTHLPDFRPDVRWIARVLDITPDAVNLAVNRLIHLGLLRLDGDTWRDLGGRAFFTVEEFTEDAIARLHDRVTTLLRAARRREAPQEHSSTTVAVSHPMVRQAIERLRTLRQGLLDELNSDDSPDEIYRLDIHWYPVTRPPGQKESD